MIRKFPEAIEKTDKTKLKSFYFETFPGIYNRELIEEYDLSRNRSKAKENVKKLAIARESHPHALEVDNF